MPRGLFMCKGQTEGVNTGFGSRSATVPFARADRTLRGAQKGIDLNELAPAPERDGASRSRGRPRQEDAAEIENVLLAAALREFLQNGYDGASMRSIAKSANVARTTLQGRYANKEDLFKALLKQQIGRMSAITSLQFEGRPVLREGLVGYAKRALEYSLETEYLEVNRLIYASANRFPELAAAAKESTRVGIAQIADFIRQCADSDGVSCRNPEPPADCFILLLRGWYGYAMIEEQPSCRAERERWIEEMVDVLIWGRAGW
jgi:TetR/AcrR family transcriptional regulator, mexJK operon transcriptional repressor